MANLHEFLQTIQLPGERFLPVNNFEGRFWISDHGKLVSLTTEFKLMSPWIDNVGYRACTLRMAPKKLCTRIHVLVGQHFCVMVDKGVRMSWNHIDGNKLNNHYSNLEYVTAAENCAHAKETGLCNIKGEKHGMSKLTDKKAKQIYDLKGSGLSARSIGIHFNISHRQVTDIFRGAAWKHVTGHLS